MKRNKLSCIIFSLFVTLMVVTFSAGIVVGAEPATGDSVSPPQQLISFLETVFTKIGKAENEFISVDLSPYFENSASNASYQFAMKRIEYYQSFRTKMFDPVENLTQQIRVIDYQPGENNIITLTVEHGVMFSYAHAHTNSGKTLTYLGLV